MSKDKLPALGKGLESLLSSGNPEENSEEQKAQQSGQTGINIELDKIKTNPYQPREEFDEKELNELAESIRQKGVITAITVRQTQEGDYELIAGERRVRASRMAGLKMIPAYIMDISTKEDMLEVSLIENLQRKDLNPIEVAKGYQRLIDECNLTQEQVAEKVSKSRAVVANYLRMFRLPEVIQESIRKGEINEGHARAILSFDDTNEQIELWKQILNEKLTVRKTEYAAKTKKKREKKGYTQSDQSRLAVQDLENKLREYFGTKVILKPKTNDSGEIIIQYFNTDDLDRILDLINR